MFMYIDANAIVGNPLLKGLQWDAVGDAVVTDVMNLYVSELTVDEAVARFRAAANAREKALDRGVRQWAGPARALLLEAIAASKEFSVSYEQQLRDRLKMLGATVVPYPDATHSDLTRRALTRSAPFDSNGNGYRDTLHWMVFLNLLAQEESSDPYAYLLSDDKGAFGKTAQRFLLAEVDELGVEWQVEFLPRITDFTVPGQFTDEQGTLDASQDTELHAVIEGAILAGGVPTDFTRYISRRAGFDDARISTVFVLNVAVDLVRVERRTQDLWVSFTAEAICATELETLEVLDEDAGDYSVLRDGAAWALTFEGTAVSEGTTFRRVAALRLTSIDGDTDYTAPLPPAH